MQCVIYIVLQKKFYGVSGFFLEGIFWIRELIF